MTDSGRKILYVDLDNTLVDFQSGIDRIDPALAAEYAGRLDEVPGIFGLMDAIPGAVDAYRELAEVYDTYILSTAPWKNESAWHDKIVWVRDQFGFEEGSAAYKRLILSHHKHLNRGDFLVDDRHHNGAGEFDGDWIPFRYKGERDVPRPYCDSWDEVTAYLRAPAQLERPALIPNRWPRDRRAHLSTG